MQAQASNASHASHASCRFFVCGNGITDHTFDKQCEMWQHVFKKGGGRGGPGMLRTLRSIYRETGMKGLYAGLPVTMVIAVPANVLYFATYEAMRDWLLLHHPGGCGVAGACGPGLLYSLLFVRHVLKASFPGIVAPLIAGGFGRAVAVSACAPLEVVRTRMQDRCLLLYCPNPARAEGKRGER